MTIFMYQLIKSIFALLIQTKISYTLSMPPKKTGNRYQHLFQCPHPKTRTFHQQQKNNISLQNNLLPPLKTIEASSSFMQIKEKAVARKNFSKKEEISALTVGRVLPDHIFVSCSNDNDISNGSCLQVLRICQNGVQSEMLEEKNEYSNKVIAIENVIKTSLPCSKMMTASSSLFPSSTHSLSPLNPARSVENFITCSDSINFYQYQPYKNQLSLSLNLSLLNSSSLSKKLPAIPTSFDYSDFSSSPSTNFYSTNINGILAKWDLNQGKATMLLPISQYQLNDVSVTQDMYAVASGDGRIVVGWENCNVLEIRDVKEGNNIFSNLQFLKVKWLDQYHLATSALQGGFLTSNRQPPNGKIFIFDVRYIKNGGGIIATASENQLYTGLELGSQPYNIYFFTNQGHFSSVYHSCLNQKYLQQLIRSLFVKQVEQPRKFEDQKYYDKDEKWENFVLSEKWKIISTKNSLYCLQSSSKY